VTSLVRMSQQAAAAKHTANLATSIGTLLLLCASSKLLSGLEAGSSVMIPFAHAGTWALFALAPATSLHEVHGNPLFGT